MQPFLGKILDLFYPRRCFYTGNFLPEIKPYRYIQKNIVSQFHFISGASCKFCGVPFHGELEEARICPNCIDLDPYFSSGKSLFLLKGPGRALIHELKYKAGFHLWPDTKTLMTQVPSFIKFASNAILVPVPLHPSKLNKRGFNQSLLLAKAIASLAKGTKVQEILKRVKKTQTQAHLDKKNRQMNVKNAFAISTKYAINSALTYIIVDDVFTTGSTLNECAKVLNQHGAQKVHVITLGHG